MYNILTLGIIFFAWINVANSFPFGLDNMDVRSVVNSVSSTIDEANKKKEAEEESKRRLAEEEKRRKQLEEERIQRQAEEESRRKQLEEERIQRQAEEESRRKQLEEERNQRQAEENDRRRLAQAEQLLKQKEMDKRQRLAKEKRAMEQAEEEQKQKKLTEKANKKLTLEAHSAGYNTVDEYKKVQDQKSKDFDLLAAWYGVYIILKESHSMFKDEMYQNINNQQISEAKSSIKTIESHFSSKGVDVRKAWEKAVSNEQEGIDEVRKYHTLGMVQVTKETQQSNAILLGQLKLAADDVSNKKRERIQKDF